MTGQNSSQGRARVAARSSSGPWPRPSFLAPRQAVGGGSARTARMTSGSGRGGSPWRRRSARPVGRHRSLHRPPVARDRLARRSSLVARLGRRSSVARSSIARSLARLSVRSSPIACRSVVARRSLLRSSLVAGRSIARGSSLRVDFVTSSMCMSPASGTALVVRPSPCIVVDRSVVGGRPSSIGRSSLVARSLLV